MHHHALDGSWVVVHDQNFGMTFVTGRSMVLCFWARYRGYSVQRLP
jgi:hypothetical protein